MIFKFIHDTWKLTDELYKKYKNKKLSYEAVNSDMYKAMIDDSPGEIRRKSAERKAEMEHSEENYINFRMTVYNSILTCISVFVAVLTLLFSVVSFCFTTRSSKIASELQDSNIKIVKLEQETKYLQQQLEFQKFQSEIDKQKLETEENFIKINEKLDLMDNTIKTTTMKIEEYSAKKINDGASK